MAEYIEREAAEDAVGEAHLKGLNPLWELRDVPAADVAPAAQWIPITERLPEKWLDDAGMVNYMIYSPDFGVDIGNYHAKAKKWLCMALPCTVTHWMPLPSGPEVE